MTVGKISSNIDAQFIVPINQVDAIFAKGNANLGGSAVLHKGSWNIIEREQHVPHPLGG
jgi:hypothetical protein